MKESTYRLIMMAGLYIGLILFVVATIALIKNAKEIKTDPIIYGMEKHEFSSCMCVDPNFNIVNIVLDDYKLNQTDNIG